MKTWVSVARRLEPQAQAAALIALAAADFFKAPGREGLGRLKRLRLDVQKEFPRPPVRGGKADAFLADDVWEFLGQGVEGTIEAVSEALRLSAAVDGSMVEMASFNAQAAESLHQAVRSSDAEACAGDLIRSRNAALSCEDSARRARRFSLENHPVVDGLKSQVVYASLGGSAGSFYQAAESLVRALGD